MSLIIFIFVITLSFIVLEVSEIFDFSFSPFVQGLIFFCGSIFLSILVYFKTKKMSASQILLGILGLFSGVLAGFLLSLPLLILQINQISSALKLFSMILIMSFGYAGAIVGLKKAQSIKLTDILSIIKKEAIWEEPKVLDTNVLIDGRIADLIELGFIKGTILIPRFVLKEIQYIADSPDPLRRAKGRKALDIMQRIKRMPMIHFEILEEDFPEIKEVDIKLIELCRTIKATIVSNDLNLIKIAQLRGVPVLNLNELAQAMRPPVLPGEILKLFIVKEGKEPDQGVAYLDDGTMVVVEEGRKYIGKTIDVVIHSVLQTSSGRMIFGRPKDETFNEKDNSDNSY